MQRLKWFAINQVLLRVISLQVVTLCLGPGGRPARFSWSPGVLHELPDLGSMTRYCYPGSIEGFAFEISRQSGEVAFLIL